MASRFSLLQDFRARTRPRGNQLLQNVPRTGTDRPVPSGTSECWNRRRSTLVPSIDFTQYLLQVRRGKRILSAAPNRLQLRLGVNHRPGRTRVSKHSPDPLTHCQTFTLGQALDVGHLDIGKHHLKALTHRVSTTSRPLSWCVALRAAAEEAQVDPWAHPYPLDQTEAVAGPEALQPCRRPSSP